MNESAADDRRSRFLSWAEKQLSRIQALALPLAMNSADDRSHLREIQKTAILSLLDTLAKAFEGGGKGRNKQAFVRLAENRASWADADRISVVHLSKALDLHLKRSPEDAALWGEMQEWLRTDYPWILNGTGEEHEISFDPNLRLVQEKWPRSSGNSLAKCMALEISQFKHSSLLYVYRNCLVHESREQTFSMEHINDDNPMYHAVDRLIYNADEDKWGKVREYHLVYPLSFLTKLVNNCIDIFREDPGVDPYPSFSFGPYLVQQLNEGNG
jgi:hypothetical protein